MMDTETYAGTPQPMVPVPVPATVPGQGPANAGSSTDIKLLLLSAFRRKWLLAVTVGMVLSCCAAFGAWSIIPAPYTAFSEIQIMESDPTFFFKSDKGSTRFQTYKETHMRMVTSPFVLGKAIRDSKIAETATLREQVHAVQWLEEELSVKSPAEEFIRISLTGLRPSELQEIVQAVTDAYMIEVVDKENEKSNQRLDALETVHSKENQDLEALLARFRTLSEETRTANSPQRNKRQEHLLDMHIQLRRELAAIKMERINTEIELKARKQQTDEPVVVDIDVPDALVDLQLEKTEEYQAARRDVETRQRRVDRVRRSFPETRIERKEAEQALVDAKANLEDVRERLKAKVLEDLGSQMAATSTDSDAQLETKLSLLKVHETELQSQLDAIKLEQKQVGGTNVLLEDLDKDIAQKEEMVRALLSEIDRIKIEANAQPRIVIFRNAETPVSPDMKKRLGGTALAGMGVFGIFVVAIAFLEFRTTRISTLQEIKDLKMHVVGYVPSMPRYATQGSGGWRKRRTQFWRSLLAESIDSTRTVLLNEVSADSTRTIMITSAMQGEGKSTLSCHLATSLARSGRRIVLVDCDLRRPSISRVFDVPVTPGVCEILRGEATLEECLQPTATTDLWVLPAGRIDRDTQRLLASGTLGELFAELEREFEFTLVDSSPLLVNDSLLVAQHAGAVLFSIRKDVSRARKVAAAHHRLNMVGARMLGAVVIGLDADCDYHRYDYYSRYYSRPVLETTAETATADS